MPEPTKKQLIKIEGLQAEKESPYSKAELHFAFVTNPAHGRKQVTSSMKCREFLCAAVRNALSEKSGIGYEITNVRAFDPTKTRLLLIQDVSTTNRDVFRQKLFSGKACLNLLEELAGWERSTITTVKHDIYKSAWLLTGPQEWISQPQLLSAATWVLRLATRYGPLDSSSYDAFEANVLNISKGNQISSDGGIFAKTFWDKIYILVGHHKEVFGEMSMEEAWCLKQDVSPFTYSTGFLTFCDSSMEIYSEQSQKARTRFLDCCKKFLPRAKK